jgi:SulP family sulfate permease
MSSKFVQELHPERLLLSLTSGLVVGIAEVIVAISFAALIFSGDLSAFISDGIGLALFGIVITSVFIALMTSLPGTVSGSQDAPVAIMAVVAAMPAAASSEEAFTTVVAFIAISTFLTGIVLLGLGYFGLGNLVRLLPYPVIGGFLAGAGWLLVTGAISM